MQGQYSLRGREKPKNARGQKSDRKFSKGCAKMKYIGKHLKKNYRVKRYILNTITAVMVLVFFLSVAAIDSESWLPFVTLFVSLGWIWLVAWANGDIK